MMKKTGGYSKRQQRGLAAFVAVILVTTGCSLLSTKDDPSASPGAAFSQNVSTNKNELPLPVEINNDIGRIVAGGGNRFVSGGSGKVNVNVNVNFNGSGWTKTVTETDEAGVPIKTREERQGALKQGAQESLSAQERAPAADDGEAVAPQGSAKNETYVVKKGDTLMKISFEKYGSVYRWREILNANKSKIADYNSLPPGLELRIQGVSYVVITRNGHPYLIRLHDTLGKISRKVYGTRSFWRDLWKNNPQLIRDPNRIYAGFTLYYRDKSELGSAIQTAGSKRLPGKRIPAAARKK